MLRGNERNDIKKYFPFLPFILGTLLSSIFHGKSQVPKM